MKKSLVIALLTALVNIGVAFGDTPEKWRPVVDESAGKGRFSNEHRFVFFAILVGLYEDGFPAEAINLIVPNENSMVDAKKPDQTNFVESCPLCKPAFDAFRTYKLRPVFYGQKVTKFSTFGFGIPEETMKGLRGSPWVRRETIRRLIEIYVTRRLESTALRDEERIDMKVRLRDMKKDGHAALAKVKRGEHGEALKKIYSDWRFCPNCTGVAPDPEDVKDLK